MHQINDFSKNPIALHGNVRTGDKRKVGSILFAANWLLTIYILWFLHTHLNNDIKTDIEGYDNSSKYSGKAILKQ